MPALVQVDVATMSDEEIYSRLKEMGASVGPIVDSTRDVYRRQLVRLLSDDAKNVNLSQNQTPAIKVQIQQTPRPEEVAAAAAAVVTAAKQHINHGILKSPDDVPRFRQGRRSVTMADTILNNNIDGTKLTNGSQHGTSSYLKKTNPLFMTLFEVFMITFLVIVGYVFYQEVLSFNQAEKEFIESSAQNFQKD